MKKLKNVNVNITSVMVKWMVFGVFALIIILFLNPLGYNYLGYRQVVESPLGTKRVVYGNGYYWKFPGSKVTTYPNLVTIAYVEMP